MKLIAVVSVASFVFYHGIIFIVEQSLKGAF